MGKEANLVMPNTIAGLLIIVIAIFPGLLGNKIYQSLVGSDWGQKEFQIIIRMIGFSVFGIVLYTVIAKQLSFPPPIHLLPKSYSLLTPTIDGFSKLIFPYIGHLASSFIAGILTAIGAWLLARCCSTTVFPSAWDIFVRTGTTNHWVVVGLKSGEAYAGKLKTANVAVSARDRDIVLEEPCIYDEISKNYKSINYQLLFISSENLFSIATIHDPRLDKRIVPIEESLFIGTSQDE